MFWCPLLTTDLTLSCIFDYGLSRFKNIFVRNIAIPIYYSCVHFDNPSLNGLKCSSRLVIELLV